MKRFRFALLVVFLSFVLTACGSDGLYRFTLIMDGEHALHYDLAGDLIITGGSSTLPAGTTLEGNLHILSGQMTVDGHITGDVFFMNGDVAIGPTAQIDGDLNLGNGSFRQSLAADIRGQVNTGAGFPLPDLPDQPAPSVWTMILRTLIDGSLLGLVAAVLARYVPKAVERVGETAIHHSLISGAVGLLVGFVGISLLVTIAYTILLIPVTLLGLFLLGVAMLYGWIGLGVSIGRLGVRILKRPLKASVAAFSGTLIFMVGLELLASIPLVGGLLGIASASVGLGAVSLTRFGLRRFVPTTTENQLPRVQDPF